MAWRNGSLPVGPGRQSGMAILRPSHKGFANRLFTMGGFAQLLFGRKGENMFFRGKSLIGGLLLCSAALSVPAAADVRAGVDAWSRGDYAAAVSQWEGPAATGDADAMFNLAQAYRLGRGVAQDEAREIGRASCRERV